MIWIIQRNFDAKDQVDSLLSGLDIARGKFGLMGYKADYALKNFAGVSIHLYPRLLPSQPGGPHPGLDIYNAASPASRWRASSAGYARWCARG